MSSGRAASIWLRCPLKHPLTLPSPPFAYDIHTSFGACAGPFDLTPYGGDSRAGGGDGADAGGFWRRAFKKNDGFLDDRLVVDGGNGLGVSGLGGNGAREMRIARFLHNPRRSRCEAVDT